MCQEIKRSIYTDASDLCPRLARAEADFFEKMSSLSLRKTRFHVDYNDKVIQNRAHAIKVTINLREALLDSCRKKGFASATRLPVTLCSILLLLHFINEKKFYLKFSKTLFFLLQFRSLFTRSFAHRSCNDDNNRFENINKTEGEGMKLNSPVVCASVAVDLKRREERKNIDVTYIYSFLHKH